MAPSMASERASHQTLFAVSALIFAVSAAATIAWGRSMSAMGGMPMPGGWTMSMAWIDAASSLQRLVAEVQAARREARLAADRASHYAA